MSIGLLGYFLNPARNTCVCVCTNEAVRANREAFNKRVICKSLYDFFDSSHGRSHAFVMPLVNLPSKFNDPETIAPSPKRCSGTTTLGTARSVVSRPEVSAVHSSRKTNRTAIEICKQVHRIERRERSRREEAGKGETDAGDRDAPQQ